MVASKVVSDEKVADKMSEKMSEMIPLKMYEMGLTAEATRVYSHGPFFVLKLLVPYVF